MATTKEKQIDAHFKNVMKNVFLRDILPGVNPVVMNYKIRHNENRPAMRPPRYSLA